MSLKSILIAAVLLGQAHAEAWPRIREIHRSITVRHATAFFIDQAIVNIQDRRLYDLRCSGPSASVSNNTFVPSGDFECWLRSISDNHGYSTIAHRNEGANERLAIARTVFYSRSSRKLCQRAELWTGEGVPRPWNENHSKRREQKVTSNRALSSGAS